MFTIDYSSWKSWGTCHAEWWEKYIAKRVPRWPRAQRDDALCLGSLVHDGLQQWQEAHTVGVPSQSVDRNTPTQECLSLAEELIFGYAQRYPEEKWPLILCEAPLVWPLQVERFNNIAAGDNSDTYEAPIQGLAKLDAFFYVPEVTEIESGVPGITYTLSPGWWIHEYKTKSSYIPLPLFIQKWEMNMQVNFQMLALSRELREKYMDPEKYPAEGVQGVLVNVLEKPNRYVPKRKCKTCDEYYEYAMWLPTGTGKFACPVCGHTQELKPLERNTPVKNPNYYRIVVSRTKEELARAESQILSVAQDMIAMENGGLYSSPWNQENCIQYKRPCGYFSNHKNGLLTIEDPSMIDAEDYRGLVEEEA